MDFEMHDGGRAAAGFKGRAGDCACRAIAIAAERDYREVYDLINDFAKRENRRKRKKSSARTGVWIDTMKAVMEHLGWTWVPVMAIGSGCKVHLNKEEVPHGRLVVRLSRHYVAVVDGVVYDNHDPRRHGNRCVYGYWQKDSDPSDASGKTE
jgi:hypothetical protein